MDKEEKKQLNKTEKRMKRRKNRRFAVATSILVAVVLLGGTFIALLIRMRSGGTLAAILEILRQVFLYNEIYNTITLFWFLVIPLLLIGMIILLYVRRNRFKYYKRTMEDTIRLAVEEERKAARREEERLRRKHRFSQLSEIVPENSGESTAHAVRSLSELCDKFRAFAANNLHLYYTEEQIRSFISGLAVSHIMILQGMSGTGKTSLTYAFGQFLGNQATIIPVQPMWKERSDLLGYYNEFTRKYNETELLRKMYEANGSDKIYLTVLDEMNIARVEYYFAEFLSLLEIPNPDLRYLEVVSDKWDDDPSGLVNGRIKLPINMWFIGTANNDDSTFAISDKVYDRAMIVNLTERAVPFKIDEDVRVTPVSYDEFATLVDSAMTSYEMTHRNEMRLKALDEMMMEKFQISFGNRIMRQIRNFISVYVSCGGDELDALDDILCKKVLRKLVYKDLSLMRAELADVSHYLEELFGEGRMPQCRDYLARIGKI